MNNIERANELIESIISRACVSEDLAHSRNTLQWLLNLEHNADEAVQIAALGHDIERALEKRKVRRQDFGDYERFKAANSHNIAEILREVMLTCGVTDSQMRPLWNRLSPDRKQSYPRSASARLTLRSPQISSSSASRRNRSGLSGFNPASNTSALVTVSPVTSDPRNNACHFRETSCSLSTRVPLFKDGLPSRALE